MKKKLVYFRFKRNSENTADFIKIASIKFKEIPEISDVMYNEKYPEYFVWSMEKNDLRKIKISKLEKSNRFSDFISIFDKLEFLDYYPYGSSGTSGTSGTSGMYGSSGTSGVSGMIIPIRELEEVSNKIFHMFTSLN